MRRKALSGKTGQKGPVLRCVHMCGEETGPTQALRALGLDFPVSPALGHGGGLDRTPSEVPSASTTPGFEQNPAAWLSPAAAALPR